MFLVGQNFDRGLGRLMHAAWCRWRCSSYQIAGRQEDGLTFPLLPLLFPRTFLPMSEQLEDTSVVIADAAQTSPGPDGASEVQRTIEAVRKPEEVQSDDICELKAFDCTGRSSRAVCAAGIHRMEQIPMLQGRGISAVPATQAEEQHVSDVDEKEMQDIRDWTEFRRWRANKERVWRGEKGTLGPAYPLMIDLT